MISKTLPEVDHFALVGPSKETLDFADLEILGLSRYNDGAGAKQKLADQVHKAMSTHELFLILNHGILEEEISRQVDIDHTLLTRTPAEGKNSSKSRHAQQRRVLGL